ncbi:MAG TPA: hypothetical protein VM285_04090 [Polyangia bacterium]|nr:hypothetical protein [Polyangia bacterium]
MRLPSARAAGRVALVVLGFAVVFGTHGLVLAEYLDSSRMNADEGYYAIAARSALEGKLPYRDFAYTQMPLLPYLNGLVMELGGYGLTVQRVVNSAWSFVALLAVVLALRLRTGSFEPGLAAAFCLAASPHLAEMTAMGKTHGAELMGMALVALAAVAPLSPLRRAAALAVCGVLAMGVRLSCAPMVALLMLLPVLEARGWRQRLLTLAIPAGTVLAVLGPFLLIAPEQMFFCNWQYHMASVFQRRSLAQALEWWHTSPGAILVLVAALPAVPSLIRERRTGLILMLAAALLGLTLPMIPHSAYGMYVIPALPLAAVGGMATIWSHEGIRRNPFRHAIWLLPALVLYHPLPRQNRESTAMSVEAVGRFLREQVPPGPILTSLPIVAVESGRDVMPGTEMGMFAAMAPEERKRARRLHFTTLADMTRMIEDQEPEALVLMAGDNVWNFKWQIPTLRRQPKKAHARFRKAVKENYESAFRSRMLEVWLPED